MAVAAVAAVVAVALAVRALTGGGGDAVRDLATPLGLAEAGPFRIVLGGPLFADRTVRDDEGTPDVAYLSRDEALTIAVAGRDGARIADLGYRVDGGNRQQLAQCAAAPCPASTTVTTRPALQRLGPGAHRLAVDVRGRRADQRATAELEVMVGAALPPVREGEPATTPLAPVRATTGMVALARRTRAIVSTAQRSGVLRTILGTAPPRFLQIGELDLGRTRVGSTSLLALPAARRNVRAAVPGYVVAPRGYHLQPVRFTAVMLRDLLVDVDLRRGRVIAVEPGPASQTSLWAPERAPTPSGARDED
ncbi:MAG: hypothetical protein JWQ20_1789 [Conexibacter sp.]|nr:hypothetical protein [Conexibacter sp.]